MLAVVEVTRRCAFPLAVSQPPPGEEATKAEPEAPRVDFDQQHLRAHRHRLPKPYALLTKPRRVARNALKQQSVGD